MPFTQLPEGFRKVPDRRLLHLQDDKTRKKTLASHQLSKVSAGMDRPADGKVNQDDKVSINEFTDSMCQNTQDHYGIDVIVRPRTRTEFY